MSIGSSHRVTQTQGDKVVIHDLELFCGYDPQVDDADGDVAKYDAKTIRDIVAGTSAHMERGSYPQLILGHNKPSDDRMPPNIPPRDCVGRIVAMRYDDRDGVPYILGDVEMSRANFKAYIESNRYPRRSAEIWPAQNHLSEVALLGSETPARPLRDTRFAQDASNVVKEVFERRQLPQLSFSNERNSGMDSDATKKLRDELEGYKAKCAKLEEELDEMKKAKNDRDGEVETFTREREDWSRRNEELTGKVDALTSQLANEKYSRELDKMEAENYSIPDRDAVLARIVEAADSDAEVEHYRKMLTKLPLNVDIDTSNVTTGVEQNSMDDPDFVKDCMSRARDEAPNDAAEQKRLYKKFLREGTSQDAA